MKRAALEEVDDQQHLRKKMAEGIIYVWTKWESSDPRCITVPITSTIDDFKFRHSNFFPDMIILGYEFVHTSDLLSTILEGNSPEKPLKLLGGKLIKFDVELSSEGKYFTFGDQFPEEFRHKVYVRECYLSLFDILMEEFESPPRTCDNTAIRFTGTPGFGKSFFLRYVLYRLLLEKKDVFVSLGDKKFSFQSRNDGYVLMNKNPVDFSDNTIHLCDPNKYQQYSSSFQHTALFVSPSRCRMGPYGSATVKDFIVPPWSEREVKECCDLLYGGYTHEYQEKFRKWGGSMRAILDSDDMTTAHLTSLLQSAALPDQIRKFDQDLFVTDAHEAYQWVLFRWPDDRYQQKSVSFSSEYITCSIGKILQKAQLDIMSTVPSGNILFSSIYKYFVREEFFHVGKNVNIGRKDYAIKKHIYFSSRDTFESTPESLYVPMEPDKEGVHFAYPPFLFQCSITAIPERSSVVKFISQFPNVTGWKMFFIVPSQREFVKHKVKQEELDNPILFENLIYDFN